jgi:hypothetical protein
MKCVLLSLGLVRIVSDLNLLVARINMTKGKQANASAAIPHSGRGLLARKLQAPGNSENRASMSSLIKATLESGPAAAHEAIEKSSEQSERAQPRRVAAEKAILSLWNIHEEESGDEGSSESDDEILK